MNPMGLSDPGADSLYIIDLNPVKILEWINQMVLSAPQADSIDVIEFNTVLKDTRD